MTRLQLHSRAIDSYEKAISLAETPEIKKRYDAALLISEQATKLRPGREPVSYKPPPGTEGLPMHFNKKYLAFLMAGGKPAPGSSAELSLQSWQMVSKGFHDLDDGFTFLDESCGAFQTNMAGIQEISEGLLLDERAFHIPASKDHKFPIIKKLFCELKHEVLHYGHEKYLETAQPETIIDDMDALRKQKGWKRFGRALFRSLCDSVRRLRYAIDTLKAGQARWPTVGDADRGLTLRFTFLRAMQCRLIEHLQQGYFSANNSAAKRVFNLDEIEKIAAEVLRSCDLWVLRPDGDAPALHLAYQVMPRVNALAGLGFVFGNRARVTSNMVKNGVGTWYNRDDCLKASDAYRDSAALMPKDNASRPHYLYHSLS
ncbi:hypothetical protein RQP46_000470 [Phenoliferia psychrophenolica]